MVETSETDCLIPDRPDLFYGDHYRDFLFASPNLPLIPSNPDLPKLGLSVALVPEVAHMRWLALNY